jgi:hypothetical protein
MKGVKEGRGLEGSKRDRERTRGERQEGEDERTMAVSMILE